ncbi:hypothetical protein ACH4FE_35640 [Streptomyces celluloflavus]|uniref:hypothetical protein n=1 Tax=Streptomyces celluloflavus TaxID=58344 RepID=UPI0037ACFCC0
MTPYERLMAEALPTGSFGDAPRHHSPTTVAPTSALLAAEHRQALEAALGPTGRRHLSAVPSHSTEPSKPATPVVHESLTASNSRYAKGGAA